MQPFINMRNLGYFIRFQWLYFGLFAAVFCLNSHAKSLKELLEGPRDFPSSQYVSVQAYRLKKPQLLWVNVPYLRQLGFEIDDIPTEAQQAEILNATAWVTMDSGVQDGEVTNEQKNFFSDYYGGGGIGYHLGSARAILRGLIQIRGSGVTPMAASLSDPSGRTDMFGSVQNAVWGDVIQRELNYGGNQIIAIVSRGVRDENGKLQTMDIRVAPNRFGHYIPPRYSRGSLFGSTFLQRHYSEGLIDVYMQASTRLKDHLPLPKDKNRNQMSEAEIIVEGVMEATHRLGNQFATMDVKRMLHGASSESNLQINGKIMDFGTSSAQPGYQRIYSVGPWKFSEHQKAEKYVVDYWTRAIEELVNDQLRIQIQNTVKKLGARSLHELTRKSYHEGFKKGEGDALIWTLGVPDAWIERLREQQPQLVTMLGRQLQVALSKSRPLNLESRKLNFQNEPEGIFARLSRRLYEVHDFSERRIQKVVREFGTEIGRPDLLARELAIFLQTMTIWAMQEGWNENAVFNYLHKTAQFRNRPMEKMYAPNMVTFTDVLDKNIEQMSYQESAQQIDSAIADSIRTTRGLKASQAPLKIVMQQGRYQVLVLDVTNNKKTWVNLDSSCNENLEKAVSK